MKFLKILIINFLCIESNYMNLFKKTINTLANMLNITQSQNEVIESNNSFATNSFVIFLIGVITGFTVCVIFVGQNIITITKIV